MNKYTDSIKIDRTKNIPYYETALLNSVQEEEVPFYYTTRGIERLDNIANKFYKTPTKWWIIAKANNISNGAVSVPEGTKLFIPNV